MTTMSSPESVNTDIPRDRYGRPMVLLILGYAVASLAIGGRT